MARTSDTQGRSHPLHSAAPVDKVSSGEKMERRRKEEKIKK
jgi:hypothetical protein